MIRVIIPWTILLAVCWCAAARAEVTIDQTDAGLTIKLDGKPFANYVKKSNNKPIIWPIIGPTGKEMTRQYPMREAGKNEKADHPHHRSFWFTHGDVNGISFWDQGPKAGVIEHREFPEIKSGKVGVVRTVNDWRAPDGKKVCEEASVYTFGGNDKVRWIDADCTIIATEKEDVKFGDTKEGSFGVRVAGTMKVDAKGGGKIINSEGQTDAGAWGKPAAWVDYHGPVDRETLGIAILNHPSSFRYPTYWHVRTYGLFAANPFGLHNFLRDNKADGSYTLKQGESLTLHYRVILHRGDEKDADIAKAFAAYAKEKK